MIKNLSLIGLMLATPYFVFAQEAAVETEGASLILQSYTFWSSVIVALMAIISTIVIAKKMKGGVFGETLNLFAIGMLCILAGYVIESVPELSSIVLLGTISDIIFIIGFLFMAMAGNLMSRVVTG